MFRVMMMQKQRNPSLHEIWIPKEQLKFVHKTCLSRNEICMEIGTVIRKKKKVNKTYQLYFLLPLKMI